MSTLLAPHERRVPTLNGSAVGERTSTALPAPDGSRASFDERRVIVKISREDVMVTVGALLSAFCATMLLFGRLTHLSGRVGFAVICYVLFLGLYATLTSITNTRPAVIDKVMGVLMSSSAAIAIGALIWVVLSTLWKGREAIVKLNLYTQDMRSAGPGDPLNVGGINHAIVGTMIIVTIALVLTVPLGIACAVFLNETGSRLVEPVRSVVTAMTALPSIVAGLFVFTVWILILGYPRSGLAAAIAVSLMMLPIITRSADVVLRLVAGGLREAAAALGAPQWRVVWHVVLPTARSGLSTAVILGVARGIGETAPVLLTSGSGATRNLDPTKNPMMSLPLAVYEFVRSPDQALIARGFATASVLMVLVLIFFSLARALGGRPAGQMSKMQSRRAIARSRDDLVRIESRG